MSHTTSTDTARKIIDISSNYYKIDLKDPEILKSRKRIYAVPRQVAMYLVDKFTKLGLAKNAALFNKDHATVIHAKKTIKDLMPFDKDLKKEVLKLEMIVKSQVNFKESLKDLLIHDIVILLDKMNVDELRILNTSLIK